VDEQERPPQTRVRREGALAACAPDTSERYESDAELIRVLTAPADEPVELARSKVGLGRVRHVFADKVALIIAMGKHSTEDKEAYRAQVVDLQAGAVAFVNFVGVALERVLDEAKPDPSVPAT
jgi:class 3 adenylate cyclase